MEAKRKRKQPAPPATAAPAPVVASVFGNADLFHEIALRLGFPTDLVRAALVCKRWLRFVSDAVFLRRYRALRPPRLLGFFALPSARQSLRFVPMQQQPLAPALADTLDGFKLGGDDDAALSVSDCRNGRLVVATERRGACRFAVLSPLLRQRHHPARGGGATTTAAPLQQLLQAAPSDAYGRKDRCFRHVLLSEHGGSDEGASCTAVTLMLDHLNYNQARVEVSDLRAGAWGEERVSNTIELPQKCARRRQQLLLAAGKIYILCMAKHILCLCLRSMDLSCIELPDGVYYWFDTNVMMSRNDDGSGFYLVHVKEFELHVWKYSTSTSTGGWKRVDTICLRQALGHLLADSSWKKSGQRKEYMIRASDN
ncbi:hypothetical protein EJB05_54434, partial [Eragrostis curvula]